MWHYLRDVFIVVGVLLIVSGVFIGWAVVAVCALALSYLFTLFTGLRRGKAK